MNSSAGSPGVDRHTFGAEDFQPVVETDGWLVALMNWSPRFDISGWGALERHGHSDEVFVLLAGRAILLVDAGNGPACEEMAPGTVYNVRRNTWHNVLGTHDVKWLIVESPHVDSVPTEYRQLTAAERTRLAEEFPTWLHPP